MNIFKRISPPLLILSLLTLFYSCYLLPDDEGGYYSRALFINPDTSIQVFFGGGVLDWPDIEGIDEYKIQIVRSASNTTDGEESYYEVYEDSPSDIVVETTVSESEYTLPVFSQDNPPDEHYFWRLQFKSGSEWSDWSYCGKFIQYNDSLDTIIDYSVKRIMTGIGVSGPFYPSFYDSNSFNPDLFLGSTYHAGTEYSESELSSLIIRLNAPENAIIGFSLSKQSTMGELNVLVDKSIVLSVSDEDINDYSTDSFSFSISSGSHTIRWNYSSDSYGDSVGLNGITSVESVESSFEGDILNESYSVENYSNDHNGTGIPLPVYSPVFSGNKAVKLHYNGGSGSCGYIIDFDTADIHSLVVALHQPDLSVSSYGSFEINTYYSSGSIDDSISVPSRYVLDGWGLYPVEVPSGGRVSIHYEKLYDDSSVYGIVDLLTESEYLEYLETGLESADEQLLSITTDSSIADALPQLTSTNTVEGSYSILFDGVGNDSSLSESDFIVTINLTDPACLVFSIYIDNGGGDITLTVNDSASSAFYTSIETKWVLGLVELSVGLNKVRWLYDSYPYSYNADAYLDALSLVPFGAFTSEDFETNDSTFSTAYDWFIIGDGVYLSTVHVHSGDYAAIFSNLSSSYDGSFELPVSVSSDSTLEFWYSMSMADSYGDYFRVYIDGSSVLSTYNDTDWVQVSENISTGNHIIKFSCEMDSSTAGVNDYIAIDDIVITTP